MPTLMATFHSHHPNAYTAAKEAAAGCLKKLNQPTPSLCLIFASSTYDLEEILKGVKEILPPATQIMGCTSAWEITENGIHQNSLSLSLIYSDTYSFSVKSREGLKDEVFVLFSQLRKDFDPFFKKLGKTTGILLIDGLTGNGEESTLCALSAFDADIKIVGGAAADGLQFKSTKLIDNDRVIENGAVLCLVKGPSHFFSGVKHGHIPLSETLNTTKARNNVLYEVNGKPAWEVWKEKTRASALKNGISVDSLKEAPEIGSYLIKYELGLETEEGYKIRVPLSKNQDGSLNFACTIPENIQFKIMESNQNLQYESSLGSIKMALSEAKDKKIAGALVFDCVCHALFLNEKLEKTIADMHLLLGKESIPMHGFETYGEICMDPSQFSGFHNTTTVISLIPAE